MPLLDLGGRLAKEVGLAGQRMAIQLGRITAASSPARKAFAVSTVVDGARSSSLTASAAASLSADGIRIDVLTVWSSVLSSSSLIRSMTW